MTTYLPGDFELLSGSADATGNGKLVSIAATSSPGTTLHTASSGTDYWDVVTIEVSNNDTIERTLTLQWGGTTDADLLRVDLAPGVGAQMIVDRWRIRNGLIIRAFADAADVVVAKVEVERYRSAQ